MTSLMDALQGLDRALAEVQAQYEAAGMQCMRMDISPRDPQLSLRVMFEHTGDRQLYFPLALNVIPLNAADDANIAFGFQTFVAFHPQIDALYLPEVYLLLCDINLQLPFGAFGVNREDRRVFFKQSVPLGLTSLPTEQDFALFVDRQTGAILGEIEMFIDRILDVADGTLSAEAALLQLPLNR